MARLILTGANQQTDWWDLRSAAETVCFMLTGTFSTSVSIHYSNVEAYSKGSAYLPDDSTYSTATGPLRFPFGIARFVRFASSGSWSVGTICVPSFAMARDAEGQLFAPTPQAAGGQLGIG